MRPLFTDFDEVSTILPRWQRREQLTTYEQRIIGTFITSVSNDRWNRHFKKRHKDWVSTVEMRLEVPLVLMDYMLVRQSVRCKGLNGYYCEIDSPKYKSLGLILYEFRLQFPVIISMLTAWSAGISVLPHNHGYGYYQKVQSREYIELHNSLCMVRKVAKELGIPLYSQHRYDIMSTVWSRLYKNYNELPLLNQRDIPRVMRRRLDMLYAAVDVLAVRVTANHDMFNKGEGYGYHNLLRELHKSP